MLKYAIALKLHEVNLNVTRKKCSENDTFVNITP